MMKQNKSKPIMPAPPVQSAQKNRKRRLVYDMHRIPRRLLVLLLILLFALSLAAAYVAWRPVTFSWNTEVLRYRQESSAEYQVLLRPDTFNDQPLLGMDQVYLDALCEAVESTFFCQFSVDRPTDLLAIWQINATVRVHDAANPADILLQKTTPVLEPQTAHLAASQVWQISEAVRINLDDFRAIALSFAEQSPVDVMYDLSLVLDVSIAATLPSGTAHFEDSSSLTIPLNQPQFRISRQGQAPSADLLPLRRPVFYQIVLSEIPLPLFLVSAGLCLLSLILFLATTSSRPKDRFRRKFRRMLRQARGRLMMIGDKAWEPEWCISVTDYRAMVRTAKKLDHPVFCYLDKLSVWPVAYFYVYYGENNYCYIYTEHPEDLPDHTSAGSNQDGGSGGSGIDEEPSDSIPVLPESDELPAVDSSPEVLLANLKVQLARGR